MSTWQRSGNVPKWPKNMKSGSMRRKWVKDGRIRPPDVMGGLGFRYLTWPDSKCNTRFIKGHKPSNHIHARIKSHVYSIEWTVYHSTYHVIDIIKRIRMLFITLMTKCLIQSMRKRKNIYEVSRKQGATGTSTGRRTPRSPRTPSNSRWTPPRRWELSSSGVSPKRTRGKE